MKNAFLVALWPLYGAALGAAGIALYVSAIQFLPIGVAALAVVLFWASVSAATREDVRIGAPHRAFDWIRIIPRVAMAAVWVAAFLHEHTSRIGVLRMTALAIVALSVSRAGAIAMAWVSRPAAGGLELSTRMRSGAAVTAIAFGLLAALVYGFRIGAGLVIGAYLILRLLRGWFYQRHSGVDGDDVAYARMAVECFTVLLAVFGR